VQVFIFLGPTLSHDDARAEFDAVYLPPAALGDVFRAAKERPFAIGIIDGYFERQPAVWHKEILWALSQGVHVFGAASMGALRAAELEAFGMRGVGEIFEAFQSGALEDDDEVAVAHGERSAAYRASSEAMVNIRATLRCAEQEGVLDAALRDRVETLAKRMFYPDRSYPNLLRRALEDGAPADEIRNLSSFVARSRIDQKRLDALELLRTIKECCHASKVPDRATFSFAHTEAWDQIVDWAETQPPITDQADAISAELLAAEVRLLGEKGRALLAGGLNRLAAGVLARRNGISHREERVAAVDQSVRRGAQTGVNKLESGAEQPFTRWLQDRGLSDERYAEFLMRDAEVRWFRERYRDDIDRYVVDELRLTEDYARLAQRARSKQSLLLNCGCDNPTLEDTGMDASALLSWYFKERIGCPVPVDLESYLGEAAVADRHALETEAAREFLYSQRLEIRDKT
jgi:hypothetical protein